MGKIRYEMYLTLPTHITLLGCSHSRARWKTKRISPEFLMICKITHKSTIRSTLTNFQAKCLWNSYGWSSILGIKEPIFFTHLLLGTKSNHFTTQCLCFLTNKTGIALLILILITVILSDQGFCWDILLFPIL